MPDAMSARERRFREPGFQDLERSPRQWTLRNGAQEVTVRVAGRAAANNPSMLKRLATAGLGLALVDELVAVDDVERGSLVRVLEDWRPPLVPVHAVTLTKSPPKKVRLLLDCLRDHIASVRVRFEAGPRPPDRGSALPSGPRTPKRYSNQ